jgi:ergothioneine biosynthesis protein EgtB
MRFHFYRFPEMESIQPSVDVSFRQASPSELAHALQDARDYTLALFDRFCDAGLDQAEQVPRLAIVNPPLWELGHVAWFAEWYILREAQSSHPDAAKRASVLEFADRWFDSNMVAHETRWSLDLPNVQAMKAYFREVHDRIQEKLLCAPHADSALYPFRLALAHEDMHNEAFAYTLQTLDVEMPRLPSWERQGFVSQEMHREIHFEGGGFTRGSVPDDGFVFDNEKWAHAANVSPFIMDASLVTNAQFAEFIEDGGYANAALWTPAGRNSLQRQGRSAPSGWQREGRQWLARRFGRLDVLTPHEPVRHVSLHEAQAYCVWSKRRLPSEAEWEYAALTGNSALRWGELWEWTASPFAPYPGFAADAYREYSAPWFGTHQVVRGASFATPARMRSAKFRNFYLSDRADIFIGFRTCAQQG